MAGWACADSPSDGFDLSIRISPTPPSVGPARLLFELRDPLGEPVTDADIVVTGRASDGPPEEPSVRAEHSGEGRYVVDGYVFDAPGTRQLEVRATIPGGPTIIRTLETPVYPGPDGG